MSEDTNLQKLFGGGSPKTAPHLPTSAPPPPVFAVPPSSIDSLKASSVPTLDVFEGLGYNRATGEAFAIWYELNDDSMPTEKIRKVVGTGWFFDSPTQQLPVFSGVNVIDTYGAAKAPWDFPTPFSLAKLINILKAHGAKVDGFEYDDANAAFPYSLRVPRILLDFGGKRAKLAAGQLIRSLCANTAEDGRQEITYVVNTELAELQRQLATE